MMVTVLDKEYQSAQASVIPHYHLLLVVGIGATLSVPCINQQVIISLHNFYYAFLCILSMHACFLSVCKYSRPFYTVTQAIFTLKAVYSPWFAALQQSLVSKTLHRIFMMYVILQDLSCSLSIISTLN